MEKIIKESFAVIGKEGSTEQGDGFIQKLWDDVNDHFNEVASLAKKNEEGNLVGVWGAMSDMTHSFNPWECEFSKGLYLAGVECGDDAVAPEGWTKWIVPGYEYLVVENDANAFMDTITYMNKKGINLVGAVHDFTNPMTGKAYMYFPVKKIGM